MNISTFIPLSSFPIAWLALGGVLLLFAIVMTLLFLLKLQEVATLKKQCEDLNETMRMMRYEEANLSRMLHTASKSTAQTETSFVAIEEGVKGTPVPATPKKDPIGDEVPISIKGLPIEQKEELTERYVEEALKSTDEQASKLTDEQGTIEDTIEEKKQEESLQSRKQAINERRPAIPTDLFAAWFAENEDTATEDSAIVEAEKEEAEMVSTEKAEAPVLSLEATSETKAEVITNVVDTVAVTVAQDIAPEPSAIEAEVLQEKETITEPSNKETFVELSKEDDRFCRKLERIVNTRLRNPNLNIDIIAAQFGIGRTNFYRKVRELTGISPNDYLRKCRMERAAEMLCSSELPVNDICAQVGMPDAQYFSRVFKAYFGVSPSIYREQHNQ